MVREEVYRYKIMKRLGLSDMELKKILSSTIKWLFLLPFLVALCFTWIAVLIINRYTYDILYNACFYL